VTHTQIAVSTVVGLVASAIVVAAYARWAKTPISLVDTLLISLTVGVSILLWREAGNTPTLNDDPIPLVSPNDVLCPVLTYVCLGLLAAFRPRVRTEQWPLLRAWLRLLSLTVNVVTI
jgi:hypothetical protein